MTEQSLAIIKQAIGTIENYPKAGVTFRDITPLLANAEALHVTIDLFKQRYQQQGITQIVGIEARGFIFGSALAYALGVGFTLLRKPGKLPREVYSQRYALEYGEDELQIHQDGLSADDKVVLIDDLLATGGTVLAAAELLKQTGATLHEAAFVIGLQDLAGIDRLDDKAIPYYTLCTF
ncbi:adenine phosphoribosyltransferase [Idiomarina tyrosinivorans]|uniref:Adenine phosphoribosyltransferase n=1 Tax=Idiomarina tyrosinivorans TaxID=1445662 RepID=A0A432ZL65_9GAMM|nr:adenine phosphoribosyltransferase [Idiomarina tyrosinivorans]RUO78765.1 adenine phosphoribosyltransferase [Idiomarina tyrosinivorans]